MKKVLLKITCACGTAMTFALLLPGEARAVIKERVYNFDDAGAVAGQLPIVIPGGARRGTQDIQPSTTDYGGFDPPANVNNSFVPLLGSANTTRLPLYAAAADRPGAAVGNLGLSFDGVDDTLYAALPATPTVPYLWDPREFDSQFDTLSQIWVKPTATTFPNQQFVYRIGNEHGGLIISTNGKWALRTGTADDGYVESDIAVQPNVWTHVAIYRGGNFSTLYVNGSIAARDPGFWGGEGPDFRLGSDLLAAAGTYFQGVVDNFSVGAPSDGLFNAAVDIDYFANLGITFSGVAGDVNQDGNVNIADYDIWKANVGLDNGFGVGDPGMQLKGDVNRSGVIDLYDFLIINDASIAMGNGALGASVPEPAALVLVVMGAALFGFRRSRPRFTTSLIGALVALLITANSAQAVLVVAEDFLYDGATKRLGVGGGFNGYEFYQGGQNGAGGTWESRWGNLGDGIVVTPQYVPPGDPPTPEPNTPFLVGMLDGNSFGPNSMLVRDFALAPSVLPTQTLYFGGKFKAETTIDATPNFYGPRLYINRIRGADVSSAGDPRDGSDDIAIGFQENMAVVRLGNDPSLGGANFGMETMTTVNANPPDDGNWHFIVGKLELNVNGGANERLTAWVDPTGPETGGTMVQMERDILTNLSELQGTFDSQATNLMNPQDPEMGRTYIDDIAIGTTWTDVATVGVPRLTLKVNRANNTARLINSTWATFDLSAYSIESTHNSLNPALWNSLDDQLSGWAENIGTASKLLESNFQGSTSLGPNGQLSLGAIFSPGANEDLTGRYTTTDGLVNVFNVQFVTEATGLPGDYNQNNKVDAADYAVWRDHL
ncbi:MAG: LamG-like jellyroll fold domain-containing protein, partial [Pirellulales bacterium]